MSNKDKRDSYNHTFKDCLIRYDSYDPYMNCAVMRMTMKSYCTVCGKLKDCYNSKNVMYKTVTEFQHSISSPNDIEQLLELYPLLPIFDVSDSEAEYVILDKNKEKGL